jgi:hypothetical protein
MELARPRKMRFELKFNGQIAVQVFDGTNGWKLRPFLNRSEVEPYTPEELKKASMQSDLDGLLVDYATKGTQIELVGTEKVEERDAFKLKLTKKNGDSTYLWIDTETFLETKIEGQPRRLDGTDHPVEIYFRDYRSVDGLQVPFLLETRVLPVSKTATGLRDTPVPVAMAAIFSEDDMKIAPGELRTLVFRPTPHERVIDTLDSGGRRSCRSRAARDCRSRSARDDARELRFGTPRLRS